MTGQLQRWLLGWRDIEVSADFSGKNVVYFPVTGNRGTGVARTVTPPGMAATFTNEPAPVSRQMLNEFNPLHVRCSRWLFRSARRQHPRRLAGSSRVSS